MDNTSMAPDAQGAGWAASTPRPMGGLRRLSDVVRLVVEPPGDRDGAFFLLGLALVVAAAETVGPQFGLATVSGRIFTWPNFGRGPASPLVLALLLLPQILLLLCAAALLAYTSLLDWLHGPSNAGGSGDLHDLGGGALLAGALIGGLLLYFVWPVIGATGVPNRGLLVDSEHAVAALAVVLLAGGLVGRPVEVHHIDDDEGEVLFKLPRANRGIAVVLNPNTFKNVLVFRVSGSSVALHAGKLIELHAAEFWVLNLDVLVKRLAFDTGTVRVASTNILTCEAQFTATCQPLAAPSTHDRRVAEFVIAEVVVRPDVGPLLLQLLSLAINAYGRDFDAEFQKRLDEFRLRVPRAAELATYVSPHADASGHQLASLQTQELAARHEWVLQELEQYVARWNEARQLAANARTALAEQFEVQLVEHLCARPGAPDRQAVVHFLGLLGVTVRVYDCQISERATEAERWVDDYTKALEKERVDIARQQQQVEIDKSADFRRAVLDVLRHLDPIYTASREGQMTLGYLSALAQGYPPEVRFGPQPMVDRRPAKPPASDDFDVNTAEPA